MVETDRLILRPLLAEELELIAADPQQLTRKAGLTVEPDLAEEPVPQAIESMLVGLRAADEIDRPWQTFWLMQLKPDGHGVGMLGFKGVPNEKGETEVGYGTTFAYRGKGLMSEALVGLLGWAFASGRCQAVTAETLPENGASQRVLSKAGFVRVPEHTGECWLWRLERETWRA